MTTAMVKGFALWFAQCTRWDTAFFRELSWQWPINVVQPIGSVMTRRKTEVPTGNPIAVPIIEKITFGGKVVVTEPSDRVGYKGRLFWACAGDLIYSKIRLKQGSLAIVPPDVDQVGVSNEYPVYCVDTHKADGAYLSLLLRTAAFQRLLEGISHGGSTKTRIAPSEFEALRVPIPPLETQRAILAEWQKARQAIAAAERRIQENETETERQFLADLGLKTPGSEVMPKVFAVPWIDFLRWSVSYNQTALTGMDLTRGRYPAVRLGLVLQLVQYGTSVKANIRGQGVPVIRMNNIVDGYLSLDSLKYVELPEKDIRALELCDGDILFNRTNSKELVGKCAAFHESGQYVFASYLIRLRTDPVRANSDYVVSALNSPIGRQQINAMSRQIIGQANINSEELRSLQIPLPPLDIQRQIMEKVAAGRSRSARERETARALAHQIEADMEGYLLGIKKVEAT
jgi:type I restriction enzyme S subunit